MKTVQLIASALFMAPVFAQAHERVGEPAHEFVAHPNALGSFSGTDETNGVTLLPSPREMAPINAQLDDAMARANAVLQAAQSDAHVAAAQAIVADQHVLQVLDRIRRLNPPRKHVTAQPDEPQHVIVDCWNCN